MRIMQSSLFSDMSFVGPKAAVPKQQNGAPPDEDGLEFSSLFDGQDTEAEGMSDQAGIDALVEADFEGLAMPIQRFNPEMAAARISGTSILAAKELASSEIAIGDDVVLDSKTEATVFESNIQADEVGRHESKSGDKISLIPGESELAASADVRSNSKNLVETESTSEIDVALRSLAKNTSGDEGDRLHETSRLIGQEGGQTEAMKGQVFIETPSEESRQRTAVSEVGKIAQRPDVAAKKADPSGSLTIAKPERGEFAEVVESAGARDSHKLGETRAIERAVLSPIKQDVANLAKDLSNEWMPGEPLILGSDADKLEMSVEDGQLQILGEKAEIAGGALGKSSESNIAVSGGVENEGRGSMPPRIEIARGSQPMDRQKTVEPEGASLKADDAPPKIIGQINAPGAAVEMKPSPNAALLTSTVSGPVSARAWSLQTEIKEPAHEGRLRETDKPIREPALVRTAPRIVHKTGATLEVQPTFISAVSDTPEAKFAGSVSQLQSEVGLRLEPGLTTSSLGQSAPSGSSAAPVMAAHAPVTAQIMAATAQIKEGVVDIALNPEELGRLRMTVVTTDTGVMITVQAERSETLEMIRRNAEVLAREFEAMGHENPSFSFGAEQQDTHPDQQENGGAQALNNEATALETAPQQHFYRRDEAASGLDLRL